jgi:hypothetical protein
VVSIVSIISHPHTHPNFVCEDKLRVLNYFLRTPENNLKSFFVYREHQNPFTLLELHTQSKNSTSYVRLALSVRPTQCVIASLGTRTLAQPYSASSVRRPTAKLRNGNLKSRFIFGHFFLFCFLYFSRATFDIFLAQRIELSFWKHHNIHQIIQINLRRNFVGNL